MHVRDTRVAGGVECWPYGKCVWLRQGENPATAKPREEGGSGAVDQNTLGIAVRGLFVFKGAIPLIQETLDRAVITQPGREISHG